MRASTPAPNEVSIHPGAMMLTRTRGATVRASALLNARTPPFTAANSCGLVPAMPVMTWSQLMLMMTPPSFWAPSISAASHEATIVPRRSTRIRRSSFSSVDRRSAGPVRMSAPALLIHASIRPNASPAERATARIEGTSARSSRATCVRRPRALMARSTSRAPASFARYVNATSAPPCAAAIAIARPIPLEPPVTSTARPVSGAADASDVGATVQRNDSSLFAMRRIVLALVAALLATAAAADAQPAGEDVRRTPPPFDAALAAAKQLPRLHSLLVSWRGDIVLERYYNGATGARPANVKSVAKSLISALVGIAIDRRLIAGVDAPIAGYFPELSRDRDARKLKITVEDLLTMRSGLESTSNRNYGAWVVSRNWVQFALG